MTRVSKIGRPKFSSMPFCRSRTRGVTPLARYAANLEAESQMASSMPFPMYTVALEDALKMTAVEPHEMLKEKALLVEFEKTLGKAVFLSHQWAGKNHPDPTFAQFSVFQDAMRNILSDHFSPHTVGCCHWDCSSRSQAPIDTRIPIGKAIYLVRLLFMPHSWSTHTAPESNLAKAIASIHGYPGFVLVCFVRDFCLHFPNGTSTRTGASMGIYREYLFFFEFLKQLQGMWPGVLSFLHFARSSRTLSQCSVRLAGGARGWCRLERTMRELSEGSWILIKSAERLELVVGSRALNFPTGKGEFAVATDKVKLGPILEAALKGKMRQALRKSDLVTYRVVRNLQSVYLKGLPAQLELDLVPGFISSADHTASIVEHFLYQNGFRSIHEVDIAGFMPLHYAALGGEAQLIKAMLEERADPTSTTHAKDSPCSERRGCQRLGWHWGVGTMMLPGCWSRRRRKFRSMVR